MGRIIFELLVLFLSPFVLYALYLAARQRDPRAVMALEKGPARYLALAGAALVVAALVAAAVLEPHHTGPYRPAEFRDGVLVPGTVR